MIVFVGQVGNEFVEREAFQEIDYRRMYGPLTKWVAQIDRVERIPEYVSHAFHCATSGRPGPVLLALPGGHAVLGGRGGRCAALQARAGGAGAGGHAGDGRSCCSRRAAPARDPRRQRLDARRGRRVPTPGPKRSGLPVGCAFRCQDLFDNRSPNYAGDVGIGINPKLAQRVKDADLLLVVGARLGEMTTSAYTLLEVPVPRQKLVHVHAGAEELGRVYQATLPINAGAVQFVEALGDVTLDGARWGEWLRAAREDYLAWNAPQADAGCAALRRT